MLCLKLLQSLKQLVELVIRYLRRGLLIIKLVVPVDLDAEMLDFRPHRFYVFHSVPRESTNLKPRSISSISERLTTPIRSTRSALLTVKNLVTLMTDDCLISFSFGVIST